MRSGRRQQQRKRNVVDPREAMMAAHAAEIAGQRQHRMVTKGDANGNVSQSRSDPKGRRRDIDLAKAISTPDVL